MATVEEHYQNHLAQYYSWLFGDFNKTVLANQRFFTAQELNPRKSKVAIDLGAGSGFQSIALAQMGYSVFAFDLSQKLLDELISNRGSLPITPIKDDMLNFESYCPENVELCVCMGDTLTHLDSFGKVRNLFTKIYRSLEDCGKLVLTYRDLIFELKDLDRFIPIKSDSKTIFTCFLEYEAEHVKINDLIYTKSQNMWILNKSCYKKLRIPADWATAQLKELGFRVDLCENDKGVITVIASK